MELYAIKIAIYSLDQHFPLELSVIIDMTYICTIQHFGH